MIIGIDPDIDKSGMAVKRADGAIELHNKTFFQLYSYLNMHKDNIKHVVVEASWLIKHNWHANTKGSAALNAKIGSSTGANHEVGRKIVEMCEFLGIDFELKRPLKKKWKGPNGKITHEELAMLVPGLPKRTNSEQRDAALLIL